MMDRMGRMSSQWRVVWEWQSMLKDATCAHMVISMTPVQWTRREWRIHKTWLL